MGLATKCELTKNADGKVLLHRFRYHLGRGFTTSKDKVLDLGCGTGYGTAILANASRYVVGLDMEPTNIDYCKQKYNRRNVEYRVHNMEKDELEEADLACAFETIEHLYKPKDFIERLKLKIKKFIVISVPIGEKLNEEKQEVIGDPTHHSVFRTPDEVNTLFVDKRWKKFYGFQSGVTYIAVYYNEDFVI